MIKKKTKKKAKVYAVGETVLDIIFRNFRPEAANPGGSAFNALISLGRMGVAASFISEVGNDRIGHYVKDFLLQNGVENKYVAMFDDGKSALALAFLNASSDAEYDFYKDYPNQRLNEEMPVFEPDDYLLFGSFYGLNPILQPQIQRLVKRANMSDALVYYDPNFRSNHSDDLEELIGILEKNFRGASIVRASDEDLSNIYGINTGQEAWKKVSQFCDYFIYTQSAMGVDLFTTKFSFHVDVEQLTPVSTIGAGDTFNAGILYAFYKQGISRTDLENLREKDWQEIIKIASVCAKEVCLSFDNYVPEGFSPVI